MIRTFLAGLFLWFALLGFFSLTALLCGLVVLGLLFLAVPPLTTAGQEAGFLLRLFSVLPQAYLQGLRLLLGVRFCERRRIVTVPSHDPWVLFIETYMVTFTPENLVLRAGYHSGLVVHDLVAKK